MGKERDNLTCREISRKWNSNRNHRINGRRKVAGVKHCVLGNLRNVLFTFSCLSDLQSDFLLV